MTDAANTYRELLTTLLVERELAGGSLPEEEESRYVEDLDRCWWAMSAAEQNDIERAMTIPATAAQDSVEVDVVVDLGEHRPPRKAA